MLYDSYLLLFAFSPILIHCIAQWTKPVTVTNTIVYALVVSGTNLFAGTTGSISDGGVFLSTNNGTSWSAVNSGLTNSTVTALAVLGTNIFAGTQGGIFLSTNNGTIWTPASTGLTNNNIFALTPDLSGNLFAGISGGGVFLSTNNGINWTAIIPA